MNGWFIAISRTATAATPMMVSNNSCLVNARSMRIDSRLDKPKHQSQSSTLAVIPKRMRILREIIYPVLIQVLLSGAFVFLIETAIAQAPPPPDAPDVVDYHKLLPLLPDAP